MRHRLNSPPAVPPPPAPLVQVADGLLTVRADDASLRALVEEIAHRGGLSLQGQEALAERITIHLEKVRLEVGVQRVLDGYRYGLQYSTRRGGAGQPANDPAHLEIFGVFKNSLEDQPVSDDVLLEFDRLRAVLASMIDAGLREEAVEELAQSQHPAQALPLFRLALADSDENVRLTAVDALPILGVGELAVDAVALLQIPLRDEAVFVREAGIRAVEEVGLATMATSYAVDALAIALTYVDPDLREQAIEALWELGGSRAVELLEYAAAADSDPSVRELAADGLEELRDGAR